MTTIILINSSNDFKFKTLNATCDNFNLYGSIAYNDKSSSIYITNITYCGGDDDTEYRSIKCTLYETSNDTKTKISTFDYDEKQSIDLESFLQKVEFKIDNYNQTCKEYQDNSLHLEIDAVKENGNITSYKIPLNLEENCQK